MKLTLGKLIFFGLHAALLVPVFLESTSGLDWSVCALILLLTFFGNSKIEQKQMSLSSFIPFLILLGGAATFALSVHFKLGPVIAASLIGLLASFIPSIFSSEWSRSAPAAIYCGTFVGMCAPMVAPNYTFIALACMFAGGIYLLVKNDLNGIGGKLGTVAFSGVLLLTYLIELIK